MVTRKALVSGSLEIKIIRFQSYSYDWQEIQATFVHFTPLLSNNPKSFPGFTRRSRRFPLRLGIAASGIGNNR